YRLGFGSPTRLVRFGFVGETASPTGDDPDASSPFMEDGAWTPSSAASTTESLVFFLRCLGGSSAGASPPSAWMLLPCSCAFGGTSTFFRDLVFFDFGAGEPASAASEGRGCAKSSWWRGAFSTGENESFGGVPRGGRGGTG